MRKRVLVAGLFHETHTFLDQGTTLADFAVREGDSLLGARGDGSPLGAVLDVAEQAGWEVVPAIDLRAAPSGTCDDAVFDRFWEDMTVAWARHDGTIDGIALVLHGAMVCRSLEDVEGEVIERLRGLPGARDVPVCGVLDLHGNVSRRTVELADGLIAYRCNPHTDAAEAAADAARLLDRILRTGRRPASVWDSAPVLWPPTATGTADDPLRTLESMAREIERRLSAVAAVNVFAGFSYADTVDAGVSFSAVTFGDPEEARAELRRLTEWTIAHRSLGYARDVPLEDIMPEIAARAARGEGPLLIVEPSDNVGGGAPGDGTSVLRALVEYEIAESAVVINDPAAAARVQGLARGSRIRLSIGGRGSRLTDGPLELEVELLSTSDGRFELEDRHSHLASMCGAHVDMGPCAVVRHGGVRILLTSRKTPPFDLGQLRSQGIEPTRLSVIGVKAAVAHRRAYDPIARASYTVATPGPCPGNLRQLPYRRVRRPIDPIDEHTSPVLPGSPRER